VQEVGPELGLQKRQAKAEARACKGREFEVAS
jgi:hypothetical protein